MNVLTVKQAIARVNSGEDLEGIVLDEDSIRQVNVRDAILVRAEVQNIEQNAQVFLFGSRARGDNRSDSDWDF